jgi:carbon-monoxide dehydrogenase medium subunit
LKKFKYTEVNSPEEASSKILEVGEDDARLIAGGTALVIMMKEGILSPKLLVDISKIQSMRKISYDARKGLDIGSAVTHLEVEKSEEVSKHYPALRDAFHTIGNVRIRAVGTVGGNLAYAEPQCNPPTILAALGASVNVKGLSRERSIPAEEFVKGIFESALEPGEVITSVTIPPQRPRSACSFYKFTTKSKTDKPTSTVSVYLEADSNLTRAVDARIVVGAVGPKTYRCRRAEESVKDAPEFDSLNYEKIAQEASEEFEVMEDVYGPASYKKKVTISIIRDALKKTVNAVGGAWS